MMILSLAEDPCPLDSKQRGLQEGQESMQPFAVLGPKTHYKDHMLPKPPLPYPRKEGPPSHSPSHSCPVPLPQSHRVGHTVTKPASSPCEASLSSETFQRHLALSLGPKTLHQTPAMCMLSALVNLWSKGRYSSFSPPFLSL